MSKFDFDQMSLKEIRALIFVAKVEIEERENPPTPVREEDVMAKLAADRKAFERRRREQRQEVESIFV